MNILAIMFLPMTLHGELPCAHDATNATHNQMIAVASHGLSGPGRDLQGNGASVIQGTHGDGAAAAAGAGSDDLMFYLSSHAQAVGDTSGPTMTPWLELRPIGAIDQRALVRTAPSAPDAEEGACARSATYVPASVDASPSGGV